MQGGICPNCFCESTASVCPRCGYDAIDAKRDAMQLPLGIILQDRYLLGRVLGMGGFGITYLALDLLRNERCAIKEFFPAELAQRHAGDGRTVVPSSYGSGIYLHGLRVFQNEARILLSFAGQEGIVQVHHTFGDNNTAYYAMEYIVGPNLRVLTKNKGERLPLDLAQKLFLSVALTLRGMHGRGLLHRDISPENILIGKNGDAKIIDFGATRLFLGERSHSLSVVLKPGYAPIEQYASNGHQGPWTDIYALCATFYALLTGSKPPDAPDRLNGAPMIALPKLIGDIPFARAVERGMMLDYRKRPQTIFALLDEWAEPEPHIQRKALSENKNADAGGGSFATGRSAGQAFPYVRLPRDKKPRDKWAVPPDIPVWIGRSVTQCDLVISKPGISRRHCVIQYSGAEGLFYLNDQSSGGTLLPNGSPCVRSEKYALSPGEIFYILSRDYPVMLGVD